MTGLWVLGGVWAALIVYGLVAGRFPVRPAEPTPVGLTIVDPLPHDEYTSLLRGLVDIDEDGHLVTPRDVHLDLAHHETDWCLGEVLDYLAELDEWGKTPAPRERPRP